MKKKAKIEGQLVSSEEQQAGSKEELRQRLARLEAAEAERARAEEALQKYADRLQALNRIQRSILAAQSPGAVAQVAVDLIAQLLPCTRASVMEYDWAGGKAMVLAAWVDGETRVGAGQVFSLDEFGSGFQELESGEVWLVKDLAETRGLGRIAEALVAEGVRSSIQVPLVLQNSLIGSLNLGAHTRDAFGPDHVEIAREVADTMAVTIHAAHLYQAEQRERQRAETLHRVVELLNASLEVDEVLQALLQASAKALNADNCSILLLDPESDKMVFRASTDIPRDELATGIRVPREGSIAGRAMRDRAPQAVSDVQEDSEYYPRIAQSIGTRLRSLLAVPLIRDGQVQGVVEALYSELHLFHEDEVNMLVAIANSAAAALDNAQLYQSTQEMLAHRTAELETIRKVAAAVNRKMTLDDILERGLTEMIQASPAGAGAAYIVEQERDENTLVLKAVKNMVPAYTEMYPILAVQSVLAFLRREIGQAGTGYPTKLPSSFRVQQPNPLLEAAGLNSGLILALYARQQLLGIIVLTSSAPGAFGASDEDFLSCIADQIAVAAENAGLLAQARHDAHTMETLLHEVNHRVKNSLAAIMGIVSLEMDRPSQEEADFKGVMQDIQSRIRGLATVHELLSATLWSPLPLDKLVSDVIHAALGGSPIRQKINVTVNAPGEQLFVVPKQATSLALVISELTTNSIKHAFLGRSVGSLRVDIKADDPAGKMVTLKFGDDGPGWPDEVLNGERESVGMRLVRMTVRSPLRGYLALSNEDGAIATLVFRLAPAD